MKEAQSSSSARRDEETFGLVYDQTRPLVYTICHRILGNQEDSLDAFQSTYARLLESMRAQTESSSRPDWQKLARVFAVREAESLRHRRRRRQRREVVLNPEISASDPRPLPDQAAADRECKNKIEILVSALPERLRSPVLLYYFQDMTQEDIAEALGASSSAIQRRISSGLRRLAPAMRQAGLGEAVQGLALILGTCELIDAPSSVSAAAVYANASAAISTGALGAASAAHPYLSFMGDLIMRTKSVTIPALAILVVLGSITWGVNVSSKRHEKSPTQIARTVASPTVSASAAGSTRESQPALGTPESKQNSPSANPATSNRLVAQADPGSPSALAAAGSQSAPTTAATGPPTPASADSKKPEGASIFGVVLRAEGQQPVGGAQVLARVNATAGPYITTANEKGEFRFEGLNASLYFLTAEKDSDNLNSIRVMTDSVSAAVRGAKDEVGPLKILCFPGSMVHVTVKSQEKGEPVAGATVAFGYKLPNRSKVTDEKGELTLSGLNRLGGALWIAAPGFATATHTVQTTAQESSAEVVLQPAGEISGSITDAEGKPLEGVLVMASSPTLYKYTATATTYAGFYRLTGLPLNREISLSYSWNKSFPERLARLGASLDDPLYGLEQHWLEMYSSGRRGAQRKAQLTPLQNQAGVDVKWNAPGDVELKGEGVITGTVVDPAGKQVAGAAVQYAEEHDGKSWIATTDPQGAFRLESLPTEGVSQMLSVRAPGFAFARKPAHPGTADKPANVTIALEPGHRVRGTVVASTGKPLRGGVRIVARSRTLGTVVDTIGESDGRFDLNGLPADVRFDFILGPNSSLRDIALELDGADVEVKLHAIGTLALYVKDDDTGKPIPRFTVQGPFEGGDRGGVSVDNAEGFYRMPLVPAGQPIQVTLTAEGYTPAVFDGIIPGSEDNPKPVDLRLKKGGTRTIAGTVTETSGHVIAGAAVTLLIHAAADREQAKFLWNDWDQLLLKGGRYIQFLPSHTGGDGRFSFPAIPEGSAHPIDLIVVDPAHVRRRVTGIEAVAGGQSEAISIALEKPGKVAGSINRERYADAARIDLKPLEAEGESQSVPLAPGESAFEFTNVPSGGYTLEIWRGQFRIVSSSQDTGSRPVTVVRTDSPGAWPWPTAIRRVQFELKEAEEKQISVGTEKGYQVRGKILAAGEPHANAHIALQSVSDPACIRSLSRSNESGALLLNEIEPGSYLIFVLQDLRRLVQNNDGGVGVNVINPQKILANAKSQAIVIDDHDIEVTLDF